MIDVVETIELSDDRATLDFDDTAGSIERFAFSPDSSHLATVFH